MKKSVILTATALGAIFTQNKNEDGSPRLDKNGKPFGYIRVENPSTIDLAYAYENGGVRKGQSALVSMTVDAWEKAKNFYKEGMEIKGNVRIVESLTGGPGFQAKLAGKDGVACTLQGQPIYRRTEFDATGLLEDTLIKHDNVIEGSSVAKVDESQALNAGK
jgi:hypothetical protein